MTCEVHVANYHVIRETKVLFVVMLCSPAAILDALMGYLCMYRSLSGLEFVSQFKVRISTNLVSRAFMQQYAVYIILYIILISQ